MIRSVIKRILGNSDHLCVWKELWIPWTEPRIDHDLLPLHPGGTRLAQRYSNHSTPHAALPRSMYAFHASVSITYRTLAKDTTYTCTPVEFPHDRKYHIVRWRPVIPAASKPYVHHMVVFQCPSLIDTVPYECGYVVISKST